jgi:hypothetical protein
MIGNDSMAAFMPAEYEATGKTLPRVLGNERGKCLSAGGLGVAVTAGVERVPRVLFPRAG